MLRTMVGIGLASTAMMTLPAPASAQPWQSINDRQNRLEHRIDMGVRNGSLTRMEAQRLRAQFNRIAWLENRYRRDGGLSWSERRDLDRRFDMLSRQIRFERNDGQDRWDNRWDNGRSHSDRFYDRNGDGYRDSYYR